MNHNRKRREAVDRERRRHEAALRDAVLVDPTALDPCNSPVSPDFARRGYYLDVPFNCASCGSEEVWTASQQKWWYEVAKGSLYSGAKLCRTCRRDARSHKGKAHPLQNARRWLGLIRNDLEPALRAAAWHPVIGAGQLYPDALSYNRGDVLVRFPLGGLPLSHRPDPRTRQRPRRPVPDARPSRMRHIPHDAWGTATALRRLPDSRPARVGVGSEAMTHRAPFFRNPIRNPPRLPLID
ncbi:hypothetical protein BSF38_00334 [Paludisphaera borealis]|uniref:Probable zinc-binding domain-containing protein n=2 Tax=Paludisphaera borealis TaxID=1387353 RepID=A0A1U7CJ12_9BACT|nr:zinc-ribbon domain-containing protein [Paludisphaera borealis]APW58922.1 hypothetical protein BSF38_00334 [Paludisphaera borealis]